MTRLVLSSLRAMGFAAATVCAASALLAALAAPPPSPPSPRPNRARRRRRPSHRWSRLSAIGTCSSAKSARDASATPSRSRKRANPQASPAIRAMRSSPTVRRKGCATKCPSSWASTSRGETRRKQVRGQARRKRVEVERQIQDVRRLVAGRVGRPGVVRDASQGRKPLGQERGERERADRRNAQRRETGGQGGVAQRPPIDRHVFPWRLRPGHGPAAERMPGEVRSALKASRLKSGSD